VTYVEPEWAMVTVAFVDIRGFTTFADRATSRVAAEYLRDFFEVVIPIVKRHEGEVNNLLGDGMLARFRSPEHADCALAAGIEMIRTVDATFGDRCRIGVGINSGLVLIGTMGGGGYLRFSLVGDPVNVAARVQDATKDVGEPLLLTEATRMLLEIPQSQLVSRGMLDLRGKAAPVAVYGLAVTNSGHPARRTDSDVGAH
jgi:class 3 adenylate cyclase